MRVGIIYLGRRGPGGPISFELANNLSKRTETFAVVSTDADHYALWQECGIELVSTRTFRSDYEAAISLLTQRRLKALCNSIREHSPDVVLYPMVHPWTPFLQHYMPHIPDVVTVHDPAPHPGLKHRFSSLSERVAARRASRCVVLSQRFVSNMANNGVRPDNIDVIPHALFSFYQNYASTLRQPRNPKSVLFFGRITKYKGIDILLRAFELVSTRHPTLLLEIVGAGDLKPYADILARMRNVNVVNQWVPDSDVAAYFENAAFVVLPYTSASQSGVVSLAASFAVPVIATRVGALPDQIHDGETGLLINPNSVTEVASAMEMLLDHPDLARQMGRKLAEHTNVVGNCNVVSESYFQSCTKAYQAGKR